MTASRRAVLLFVLGVLAAPASPGVAQTARPAAAPAAGIDILPEVIVRPRRRFPDEVPPPVMPVGSENIIVQRMPRLMGCFTADTWSPDPTAKFNRAYYEELTGEAGYYNRIRTPAAKIEYHYFSAIHAGETAFANLDGANSPGSAGAGGGAAPLPGGRPPRTLQTGYRNCGNRSSMEKDVTFARGLAMYDKGEYAQALATFEEAYVRVRNSQMAGEVALMIAGLYLDGKGAARDVPRGVEWLKKAAGAPLAGGAGGGYSPGRGTFARYDAKDPDHYYTIAGEAAMKLSVVYLIGDGVAKDDGLSRKWVETAMRHNHVPAMKIAADMYYTGFGGRQNLRDALLFYQAAARPNHVPAAYAAGEMFDLGEGTRPDRKEALRYYGQAAFGGDAKATFALAMAYDTGNGVKADQDHAVALYKIAAMAGHPQAQTALGTYFYEGGMVERISPSPAPGSNRPRSGATRRAWSTSPPC